LHGEQSHLSHTYTVYGSDLSKHDKANQDKTKESPKSLEYWSS